MKKIGCIFLVLIAGCNETTISSKDCQDDHWYDRGFASGSSGKPAHEGKALARSCRAYDDEAIEKEYTDGWLAGRRTLCTAANGEVHGQNGRPMVEGCPEDLINSYQAAWEEGLRSYCKPSKGYSLGQSGAAAPSFCPRELHGSFMEAYYKGRDLRLHGTNKERTQHSLYFEIEDLNQQILEEDNRLSKLGNFSDDKTQAQLKQYRAYRDHLIEKRAQLERQAGIS